MQDGIAALPQEQQAGLRELWQKNVEALGIDEGTAATLEAVQEAAVTQETGVEQEEAAQKSKEAEAQAANSPEITRFLKDFTQRTGVPIEFGEFEGEGTMTRFAT